MIRRAMKRSTKAAPRYDPTRYDGVYNDTPRYDPSRYDPVYNDTPRYDPLCNEPKFLERAHFAPQYSAYSAETLPRRRGVLLILVLGLLAMFGMIGLSFLMMSSHQRQGAEVIARIDQQEFAPEQVADEAILQVLRGTENPLSVLRNHSLLEDMYGQNLEYVDADLDGIPDDLDGDGIPDANIADYDVVLVGYLPVGAGTSEEIIECQIASKLLGRSARETLKLTGRLLTFTSGLLKGKSARIVGVREDPTDSNEFLAQFLSPELTEEQRAEILNLAPSGPTLASEGIVNGSAFGGTGFGFNTEATIPDPLLTARDSLTGGQQALLPNPIFFNPRLAPVGGSQGVYLDPSGRAARTKITTRPTTKTCSWRCKCRRNSM